MRWDGGGDGDWLRRTVCPVLMTYCELSDVNHLLLRPHAWLARNWNSSGYYQPTQHHYWTSLRMFWDFGFHLCLLLLPFFTSRNLCFPFFHNNNNYAFSSLYFLFSLLIKSRNYDDVIHNRHNHMFSCLPRKLTLLFLIFWLWLFTDFFSFVFSFHEIFKTFSRVFPKFL